MRTHRKSLPRLTQEITDTEKKVRLEFGQINKSVSSDFERCQEESRAVLSVK